MKRILPGYRWRILALLIIHALAPRLAPVKLN